MRSSSSKFVKKLFLWKTVIHLVATLDSKVAWTFIGLLLLRLLRPEHCVVFQLLLQPVHPLLHTWARKDQYLWSRNSWNWNSQSISWKFQFSKRDKKCKNHLNQGGLEVLSIDTWLILNHLWHIMVNKEICQIFIDFWLIKAFKIKNTWNFWHVFKL